MITPELEAKVRAKIDVALRNKDYDKAAKLMVYTAFLKTDPEKFAAYLIKKIQEFKMQPSRRNPFMSLYYHWLPLQTKTSDWAEFWQRIEREWAEQEKMNQNYWGRYGPPIDLEEDE